MREQELKRAKLNIQQGMSDYLSKKREQELLREQTLKRARLNIQKGVSDFLANSREEDDNTIVSENYEEKNNIESKNIFKIFEDKLSQWLNELIEEDPKLKILIEEKPKLKAIVKYFKSKVEPWDDKAYSNMNFIRDYLILIFYLISLPLLNLLPLPISIPLMFAYTIIMYIKYR